LLTIYLNNNRFNLNHGHVLFCKQICCDEILIVSTNLIIRIRQVRDLCIENLF
jgi:hypothetical protein